MSDATQTPAADISMDEALSQILNGKSVPEEAPAQAAPEAPVQEPAIQEAPQAEEEPPRFAHKFTALAKKEQKLLEAQKALKAQEEAIRAESVKTQRLAQAMDMLTKDPIGALEALGVDPATLYADLTEQSLSGSLKSRKRDVEDTPDIAQTVRAEIEALRKELYTHELEKERTMGQLQAREVVDSDPDRWAYIKAQGAESEVWNVIEMYHEQHGKILDFQEAADMVEGYLESEAQKFIEATNRKKARVQPAQPSQQQPVKAPVMQQPQTLTNSMAVKTPPSIDDEWEKTVTDPAERKKYILKELENLKF